ncbi:MAG: cupin domain-containing protein [Alphaproteobacteria bacterium]|nr:cupin domain-containing protein [Alphaproteobacteria bacterium]
MVLDTFPSAEEFYKTYWGKKPFVVRGGIDKSEFDNFIDGDTLAGLSLEDDIKSRLVVTSEKGWVCEHGPFEEDRFSTLGDKNWSLLVQNIDQYHPNTSSLLRNFDFSPRWLMDDIMVSYSTVGGTVGPHTDSYHVFLVQGKGKRNWKVSHAPILDGKCLANQDLKVLEKSFDGQDVNVTMGDIIYIPPHFAHEGKTLEEAMTFSVGFLGPQLSEMFVEYGYYLEQNEQENKRFVGQGIDTRSSTFLIGSDAVDMVKDSFSASLQSDSFSAWMVKYFSTPTHDDIESMERREHQMSEDEVSYKLEAGGVLRRDEQAKIAITKSDDGILNLAVYGSVLHVSLEQETLVLWLNQKSPISIRDIKKWGHKKSLIQLVTELYNMNVLTFDCNDD